MKRTFLTILVIAATASCLPALCQETGDLAAYLSQKFTSYCNNVPREEMFVATDREEYMAGEDLWLKLYLFDRRSMLPSGKDKIVYVELLDKSNKPVIQKRFAITGGSAPAHLVIPPDAPSGCYTLRAYTSWMKNFLPENCFMSILRIYNPFPVNETANKFPVITYSSGSLRGSSVNGIPYPGINLKISHTGGGKISVAISTDDNFRKLNSKIYLFIQTHGNIDYSSSAINDRDEIIINPNVRLRPGINQVTLFNKEGRPVAEKYIFTRDDELAIYSLSSSDTFKTRDRIDIRLLKETGAEKETGNTSVTLSVAPFTNNAVLPSINEYLVFASEYGPVDFCFHGTNLNNMSASAADSLLSAIHSNWINWTEILGDNRTSFEYPHEDDSYILKARLIEGDQLPAREGKMIYLCLPGKKPGFQYAVTDSNGNFSFRLNPDVSVKDVIIMPAEPAKNERIVISSSFSDKYFTPEISYPEANSSPPAYTGKWSLNYQVMKVFRTTPVGKELLPPVEPLRKYCFYGKPDFELKLADYIRLPLMEEVVFELLPMVSMRKKPTGYDISINDWVDGSLQTTKPLLMIDGVVIRDASLIAGLETDSVESVDVIKNRYQVGRLIIPSLMNVKTRSADFTSVQMPDYMLRQPFRVAEPVPSFVSPDYNSASKLGSRIPDYRNTLYWAPGLGTDKNGNASFEFWSSDNQSAYLVKIQGLTSSGKPFTVEKVISVK